MLHFSFNLPVKRQTAAFEVETFMLQLMFLARYFISAFMGTALASRACGWSVIIHNNGTTEETCAPARFPGGTVKYRDLSVLQSLASHALRENWTTIRNYSESGIAAANDRNTGEMISRGYKRLRYYFLLCLLCAWLILTRKIWRIVFRRVIFRSGIIEREREWETSVFLILKYRAWNIEG